MPVVNKERFKIGQWPGLRRRRFCCFIWRDIILSLLNKMCVNSGTIRRHGGGIIDD